MDGLILGVNTWYRLCCFFKLFAIGPKELKECVVCAVRASLGIYMIPCKQK